MDQRLRALPYNYWATENTLLAAVTYIHVCLYTLLHVPLFLKLYKDLSVHMHKKICTYHPAQGGCFGLFFVPFCVSLIFYVLLFLLCSSISSHIKFGTDVFLYSYGNKTEKILGLGLKMFLCFFFRERFSISLKLFNVYSWSFGQIFVYYPGMLYWYGMLPFPWNHLWFLGSF